MFYDALEIASGENGVNYDVMIAVCLLHDIGRKERIPFGLQQFKLAKLALMPFGVVIGGTSEAKADHGVYA